MSVEERDHYSGYMTTGHEWNGIKELNTPVPKVLIGFLLAAFIFSLGYWYAMPAFPLGDTYTRGKLGFDQTETLQQQLASAEASQAVWSDTLATASFDEIRTDEQLMRIVQESGPALYRDNCSVCHGSEGEGAQGFPRLSDSAWLWGSDADGIYQTLRVGINADHPETRVGNMPALGKSGALGGAAVRDVVTYLRSLENDLIGNGSRASELLSVHAGKKTYATVCAACHGPDRKGNTALGAPNLSDNYWLYGDSEKALFTSIWTGRGGHMPAWESRLSDAERKILTLHVLSLSGSGADAVAVQ